METDGERDGREAERDGMYIKLCNFPGVRCTIDDGYLYPATLCFIVTLSWTSPTLWHISLLARRAEHVKSDASTSGRETLAEKRVFLALMRMYNLY